MPEGIKQQSADVNGATADNRDFLMHKWCLLPHSLLSSLNQSRNTLITECKVHCVYIRDTAQDLSWIGYRITKKESQISVQTF